MKITLLPGNTLIYQAQSDDNAGYAAYWLQLKLRYAYGVEAGFDIVKAVPETEKNIVQVGGFGPVPATLDPYGFVITKSGKTIHLYGFSYKPGISIVNQNNLICAANYFLDAHCGIRQYLPMPDWCTQLLKPVELDQDFSYWTNPAVYQTVGTGMIDHTEQTYLWGRAHGYYNRLAGTHQHSIDKLNNEDGQNPDISDPTVIEKAKVFVTEYFKSNPDAPYVSLTIMDTDAFPQTESMQKALEQYGSMSEVMINFVRKIAAHMSKNHKGKKLLHLSYGIVRDIPKAKLPSNVVSVIVQRVAELDAKGSLFSASNQNPASLPDWLSKASQIGLHDWAQGVGYLIPRLYTSQYHKLFNFLTSRREKLYFLHIECYPNYGIDVYKYWMINALNFNPGAEYWGLVSQFCKDMFPEAGIAMYGYFYTLEMLSLSMQNNTSVGLKKMYVYWGQFRTNEQEHALLNRCRLYIDLALTIAANSTDAFEHERISYIERAFTLSRMLIDSQRMNALPQGFRERTIEQAKLVGHDEMSFYHNFGGTLADQVQDALNATTYMKPTV